MPNKTPDLPVAANPPLPPVMAPEDKSLLDYSLHDWQGTEHSKDCQAHLSKLERPLAEHEKLKAAYEKEQAKLPVKERRPFQRFQPPLCEQIWKTEKGAGGKDRLIDACCPNDIVVCASDRPLILQADAHPDVRKDSPRIETGDRRRGSYYVRMIGLPVGTGLQRIVDIAAQGDIGRDRLIELEIVRQRRTGERPADWVLVARERAAQGHDPRTHDNIHSARAALSSVARSW